MEHFSVVGTSNGPFIHRNKWFWLRNHYLYMNLTPLFTEEGIFHVKFFKPDDCIKKGPVFYDVCLISPGSTAQQTL